MIRYSHPIFDQPGPGDVMIYSILFKFPASWWITSHRLLTSSTTSATFSALHGTHVKVPNNKDIMDLVLKFPASWWIISHCPFTPSTTPATFTALHGTQATLKLKRYQSAEWLYFSSAGYHTVDHTFYSYFTLLSNLLFLPVFFEYFTSYLDWTLVARLRYLVWLVLTMDSYASRST